MNDLSLITCIVQRGRAEKVVDAALKAGAPGATYYYGRGTGVRQKLGVLSKLIVPEKDLLTVTRLLSGQGIFHQADAGRTFPQQFCRDQSRSTAGDSRKQRRQSGQWNEESGPGSGGRRWCAQDQHGG